MRGKQQQNNKLAASNYNDVERPSCDIQQYMCNTRRAVGGARADIAGGVLL